MEPLTEEQARVLKNKISEVVNVPHKSFTEIMSIITDEVEDDSGFLDEDSTIEDIKDLRKGIMDHFTWDLTPQGQEYWEGVYENLNGLVSILENE